LSCAGMPVESEVYFCPDHLMVLQVITRTKPYFWLFCQALFLLLFI
jgi:hypothetical protein